MCRAMCKGIYLATEAQGGLRMEGDAVAAEEGMSKKYFRTQELPDQRRASQQKV